MTDSQAEPTLRDELRAYLDIADRIRIRFGGPMNECGCDHQPKAWCQPGCEREMARNVMFTSASIAIQNVQTAARSVRLARAALVEREGWAVGFDPDGDPVWLQTFVVSERVVASMTVRDDPRALGWTYGGSRNGAFVDGGTFETPIAAMEAAEASVAAGPIRFDPEIPEQVDWAARLRAARVQKGVTLRDLASLAGISAVDLSRYERARAVPTADEYVKIAAAMGIS